MKICGPAQAITVNVIRLSLILAGPATVAHADTISMFPSVETPSSSAYRRGLAELAAGEPEKAAQAFADSLKLDPNQGAPHLGLAELAAQQHQTAEVEKHLKQALALDPKNARIHRAWGRHLVNKKEFVKAEAAFKQAVALDPRFTEAQMDLGALRATALKQPQKAIEAYRAAVASDPDRWQAHYALGVQLGLVGQHAEAHKALQAARRLVKSDPAPTLAEGRLYAAEQKPDEALAAFDEIIRADPKFVPAVLARAEVYRLSKRDCAAALADYRTVLRLDPDRVQAHAGMGRCLSNDGQSVEAVEHLVQATRLSRNDPLLWSDLGQLYGRRRQYADAVKAFDEALKINNQFLPALIGRADIYLAQGRLDLAGTGYSAALTLAPKSSALRVKLGIVALKQHQWGQAKARFEQALERNPKNADAWNNLAWMAMERKADLDEAVEWSQKAIALQPTHAGYRDTLGLVYRARGELTRAAAHLNKAVELDPKDPLILYHLGLVYAEQERPEQAKTAFTRAVSLQEDFEGIDDARKRLSDLERPTSG